MLILGSLEGITLALGLFVLLKEIAFIRFQGITLALGLIVNC